MDESVNTLLIPYYVSWWMWLAIGVLLVSSVVFWRLMLLPFVAILYVEGFFRNMFDTPAVLLIKDVVIGGIYIGFCLSALLRRQWPRLPASLAFALACLFVISGVQILNPALHSWVIGLVGMKVYFYYMPLLFVIPGVLKTRKCLYQTLGGLLLLALPVAGYGIVQYFQGPEVYSSMGPAFQRATFVIIGEYFEGTVLYRPNSTFAWPSHFTTFLHFAIMLAITAMHLRQPRRVRRLAWFGFPILLVATLLGGQRALYLLIPATVIVMLVLARGSVALLRVLIGLTGVGVGVIAVAPQAIVGRFATIVWYTEENVILNRLQAGWAALAGALHASPLGLGTGTSALGARHVSSTGFIFTESYLARLTIELGLPGLLVFLWLYAALMRHMWLILRRLKDNDLRYLAAMGLSLLGGSVLGIYASNSLDIAISAVNFWLTLGLVRSLPQLDTPGPPPTPHGQHHILKSGPRPAAEQLRVVG